jgi:cell division protein FtsZ
MMKFDLPHDNSSIIKVIGVGGGGSNAVNHMYKQGIKGVDFIVCNTDQQALDVSPVPLKIVLGASLTKGRGAGSLPEVGKNAAIENIEEVKALLANNTEMVFITAGLGGGTGTGAAPIIAKAAKEMGILTVGIVTIPFGFEGKKRKAQADEGLEALKANVDTLLVISNDKLREIYGNLKVTEAFGHADDILATAAKGIADIITTTLQINTDINDVKTVMKESGVAIMGSAMASGEQRALRAVEQAMSSPLLNDSNIKGARYVLVNVTCGEDEITMDELGEITDYIQDAAGMTAEVIKGYGVDLSLGDKVNVTIIATGFNSKADVGIQYEKAPAKIVHKLIDDVKVEELPFAPVAVVTEKVEEMISFVKAEEMTSYIKEEVKAVVVEEVVAEVKVEEVIAELELEEIVAKVKVEEEVAEEILPILTEEVVTVSEVEEDTSTTLSVTEVVEEPVMFLQAAEETPVANVEAVVEEIEVVEAKIEKTPTFEFEITNTNIVTEEPFIVNKTIEEPVMKTEPVVEAKEENSFISKIQDDEQLKKAQDRVAKLKELSFKLKSPNGLSELENEPAYKRRNVNLDATPHSSESQVSRYTLSEGDDKKVEIKPNNSFLHDNVD